MRFEIAVLNVGRRGRSQTDTLGRVIRFSIVHGGNRTAFHVEILGKILYIIVNKPWASMFFSLEENLGIDTG